MGRLAIECLSRDVNYRKLAKEVYKLLGQKDKLRAELTFLNEDEMMRLNSMARHVDKVTDVLSFPSLDNIRGRVVTAAEFPTKRRARTFISVRSPSAKSGRRNRPRNTDILRRAR